MVPWNNVRPTSPVMPFSYLMSFLPLDVLRLLTHCLIPSAFEPQLNQIERRVWVDELPFVQISCHSFSDKESPISANSIKTTKKVPRPLLFNSGNTQQVSRSNWLHKLNTFVYIHLKKKKPLLKFTTFLGSNQSRPIPSPAFDKLRCDPGTWLTQLDAKTLCLGKS